MNRAMMGNLTDKHLIDQQYTPPCQGGGNHLVVVPAIASSSAQDGSNGQLLYEPGDDGQRHRRRRSPTFFITNGPLTRSSNGSDPFGLLYVLKAKDANLIKVGFTTDSIPTRLNGLRTGCPFALEVIMAFRGHRSAERKVHKDLKRLRMRGEWFRYPRELQEFFRDIYRRGNYRPVDLAHFAVFDEYVEDQWSVCVCKECLVKGKRPDTAPHGQSVEGGAAA